MEYCFPCRDGRTSALAFWRHRRQASVLSWGKWPFLHVSGLYPAHPYFFWPCRTLHRPFCKLSSAPLPKHHPWARQEHYTPSLCFTIFLDCVPSSSSFITPLFCVAWLVSIRGATLLWLLGASSTIFVIQSATLRAHRGVLRASFMDTWSQIIWLWDLHVRARTSCFSGLQDFPPFNTLSTARPLYASPLQTFGHAIRMSFLSTVASYMQLHCARSAQVF